MNFRKIVILLVALALIIAGATIYLKLINESKEEAEPQTKSVIASRPPLDKQQLEKPTVEKKANQLPKLAIVIDDIGNSKELGEEVLALKNVTIAIIPELKYSLYFANKGNELGKDILVHAPMEPKSKDKYSNESKLLRTDMSDDEVRSLTLNFIKSIPFAKGVNNHMGSKFTENKEKIEVFLKVLKEKNMFFLDSRTSSDSVAFKSSIDFGLRSYKRDVFLDHEISEEKISQQLDNAIAEAHKNGYAVAIGHPHQETINVLKGRYNEITKSVEIVPISKLQ